MSHSADIDTSDLKPKIRSATPADAPVIVEFNLLLARETEALALDPACVKAGVAALLADPAKGVYYVAEVNGRVAGQLMITYEWSDWRNGNIWWIQSVYVATPFRRGGVFRSLFEHVKRLALDRDDVSAVRLYVHSENARAHAAYEQLGMKRTYYQVFELGLKHGGE